MCNSVDLCEAKKRIMDLGMRQRFEFGKTRL